MSTQTMTTTRGTAVPDVPVRDPDRDDQVGHPAEPARPLEEVEAELTGLAARIAGATCRFLELLAEFDARDGWAQSAGMTSTAQWLSWRCAMSAVTAREHVRIARALTRLPLITHAFAQGRLSYSKVRALTRVATPETERELLQVAAATTANQLDRFCAGVRTATTLEEVNARHAQRRLSFRHEWDGSISFTGRCSPEDGASIIEALRRVQDYLHRTGTPHTSDPEPPSWNQDEVTAGRALIDALILLCEHATLDATTTAAAMSENPNDDNVAHTDTDTDAEEALTGAGDASATDAAHAEAAVVARGSRRSETVLHVTLDDLAIVCIADTSPASETPSDEDEPHTSVEDSSQENDEARPVDVRLLGRARPTGPTPAGGRGLIGPRLEHGPALHPETARRLTCDTGIVLHVHDADDPTRVSVTPSARPGATIDLGRRSRTPNAAQFRALWDRDHGCRFPGCERRRYLHAHHIIHWADGGPTDLQNLVLLCGQHHRLHHEGGFQITRQQDGTLTFHAPGGRQVVAVPRIDTPAAALAAGLPLPARGPGRADAAWHADGSPTADDPADRLTPVGGGPLDLDYTVSTVMDAWEIAARRAHAARTVTGTGGPDTVSENPEQAA